MFVLFDKDWNEHKTLGCFADLKSVQDMINNLDDLLIQKREYAVIQHKKQCHISNMITTGNYWLTKTGV